MPKVTADDTLQALKKRKSHEELEDSDSDESDNEFDEEYTESIAHCRFNH